MSQLSLRHRLVTALGWTRASYVLLSGFLALLALIG